MNRLPVFLIGTLLGATVTAYAWVRADTWTVKIRAKQHRDTVSYLSAMKLWDLAQESHKSAIRM